MRWKKKKKTKAQIEPRYKQCVYCNRKLDLNGHNWVCDGSGDVLHTECFNRRWGLIKDGAN